MTSSSEREAPGGVPQWERTLRGHLTTLCMAVIAGSKGDVAEAANITVDFCRGLRRADGVSEDK